MEGLIEFARKKHEGQSRKFSPLPYFTHPEHVAKILKELGENEDLIKAAYLHDTLEDTNTTCDELKENFGSKIANLVRELTSDRMEVEKLGKPKYLTVKMNAMSKDALTIKLADRLDNVQSLSSDNPEFSERYAHETREILENLKRSLTRNQRKLYNLIMDSIKRFFT